MLQGSEGRKLQIRQARNKAYDALQKYSYPFVKFLFQTLMYFIRILCNKIPIQSDYRLDFVLNFDCAISTYNYALI